MKILTILTIIFPFFCFSQVGFGTANPSSSTIVDMSSESRGVLLPRIALTSITDSSTITNGNISGLLIYNTTNSNNLVPGYYTWNGSSWQRLIGSSELSKKKGVEIISTENGSFVRNSNNNLIWTTAASNNAKFNSLTKIAAPFESMSSNVTVIPSTNSGSSDAFTCSKNIISITVYSTIHVPEASVSPWKTVLLLNGVAVVQNDFWGRKPIGQNNERCSGIFTFGPIPKDTLISIEIQAFDLPQSVQNANTYIVIEYEI